MSDHPALVRRAVELIAAEPLSIHEAVEKVLADVDLDQSTTRELVRAGLGHMVAGVLSRDRGRGFDIRAVSDPSPEPAVRSGRYNRLVAPGETSPESFWLHKFYAAANGTQRPILDFTADDVRHALEDAAARSREWGRRRQMWERIDAELVSRRANRVSELPAKKLAEINVLIGSVLGGVGV